MEQLNQDPQWDLIPQHATGIVSFHEMREREANETSISNPAVVTIGILDTGIDPAIFHNNPKIKLIDCIDCTSSGDVDVSHEAELEKVIDDEKKPMESYHYQITGLSGRRLKLSKELSIKPFPSEPSTSSRSSNEGESMSKESTSGELSPKLMVRLGISIGYQLFPKSLVATCRKYHHLHKLDVDQHIGSLHEKIAEWNQTYGNQKDNQPTTTSLRQRDDWQAQLDVLQKFTSTSDDENDPGPVYDCVVYWDGTCYRTLIDVNESGDLRSLQPLTSFGDEHEYGTFPVPTTEENVHNVNFAIQFYNHGKVLSIVTDCSPHGTHVAQIAATTAASGLSSATPTHTVNLISFKIGDPRVGTMETGPALIRALQLASASKQYHCDVVNISYGEAVVHAKSGQRFIKCVNDCVYKHNTLIVCAAGNHGPALTTNNAPGGVLSACLSIAAVVTPNMRETLYSILPVTTDCDDDDDGTGNMDTTFTWSSVGPTADGDWGVNLCAPGGAIASVPQWCMSKSQLMNGTSMASPHATGCVALLIGACKAENIPFTPVRIRRALENTSEVLANRNPLEQGCGMIQVDKAWEYLKLHRGDISEDVGFNIEIVNPYNSSYSSPRGIYLRQIEETNSTHSFTVSVSPKFSEVGNCNTTSQRKIDFEQSITLSTTCLWTKTATKFILSSDGRTFDVEVDTTNIGHGLHVAAVHGTFQYNTHRKIIFSVPIIIAKPILPIRQMVNLGAMEFRPAEIKRFYVVPPFGSTWMDITIEDKRDSATDTDKTSRAIALHTVQLLDHAAYRDNECNKRIALSPGQTHISSISVEANVTCEVVLARYWLTRRATLIDVRVQFRGIRPVPNELTMIAGSGGTMVRTYSDLCNEVILPTCKLTKWQVPLRPLADVAITPLHDERDCIFAGEDSKKGYEMILTYTFEQDERGSFTARAPALQGVLYEAAFESQCMFVFDGEKKFLGMSDAYPSSISAAKGTVVIRLQVRHSDPTQLEKFKDMVIWIERNLSKELSLSVYNTKENMLLARNSFIKSTMKKGSSMPVFLSEPEHSQLPTNYASGHRFIGSISFAASDESLPGAGKRPKGYPICYTVGPIVAKKIAVEAKSATPTIKSTLEKKMNEAVRDLKIGYLSKIVTEQSDMNFDDLWNQLVLDYPENLQLYMAKLKYLDENPNRHENLAAIILAANDIISRISEDDLAKCLGRRVDLENGDSIQTNKDKMIEKDYLIEAFTRLAFAIADSCDAEKVVFTDTIRRLSSWIDMDSSPKLSTLLIVREMQAGMYGLALKRINAMLDGDKEGQESTIRPMSRLVLLENRASIFKTLGFNSLLENELRVRAISCPKSFRLF